MCSDSSLLPPVVCVGASAGGLEAIEKFFRACPNDLDVAYVVIQHLSTDYKSVMDDLLSRYTSMPVKMAEHNAELEINTVYLIPAGKLMKLEGNHFSLYERDPQHLSLPIDIFLMSLSKETSRKKFAVILSGTGSDGTRGCTEVNSVGGVVLVQEPEESKFDGMPRSAISAGVADFILLSSSIPDTIKALLENSIRDEDRPSRHHKQLDKAGFKDAFDGIMRTLKSKYDIDFAAYKPATVTRRIERRMQVNNRTDISEYFEYLQNSDKEVYALRKELLIPVTSFFRDKKVFDFLEKTVIPNVVKDADTKSGIRIWVAGCSTGEEAYSICMLFKDEFQNQKRFLPLKIFATDINPEVIDFASAGRYPESIVAEIEKNRLSKYFEKINDIYLVRPELRQSIVFARHNLISDAPFTRMNFVSCRNTLIYFNNEAQITVIKKLQYATNRKGYLFLGSSESLSVNENAFDMTHSNLKVFQRKYPHEFSELKGAISPNVHPLTKRLQRSSSSTTRQELNLIENIQLDLLKKYTPPTIVINEDNTVIHTFGSTRRFLRIREGRTTLQLNRMLPDPLVPVAFSLINRAKKLGDRVESDELQIETIDNEYVVVRLSVKPTVDNLDQPFYSISIIEVISKQPKNVIDKRDIQKDTLEKIRSLENELSATRESLQSTIEELETTNEELQATNEELMASNEELQSSNEELQSVNEELNTVNSEYQEKMIILNRINADLDNLTKSVGIPTIFLDQNRNITRYTPECVKIFKIRQSDIGRPIDEIVHNLEDFDLSQAIQKCVDNKTLVEIELKTLEGDPYLGRILSYFNPNGEPNGFIITLIDVNAIKISSDLKTMIDALPENIAVLDNNGIIVEVNQSWVSFAKENGDITGKSTGVGADYLKICKVADNDESANATYTAIKDILAGNRKRFSMTYPCHSHSKNRWFVFTAVKIQNHERYAVAISHFEITDWYSKNE